MSANEKKSPELIIKESVANLEEITSTFKRIHDKETATKEIPKLKEVFKKTENILKNSWAVVMKKLEEIGKDKEKLREFAKNFTPLNQAYAYLTIEKQRVLEIKNTDELKKLIKSKEWLVGYMKFIFY